MFDPKDILRKDTYEQLVDFGYDLSLITPIYITDLPNDDLKLIANECGVELAVKLLVNLPGVQLQLPKSMAENSGQLKLALRYLSEEQLMKLQRSYGGLSLSIPRSGYAIMHRKNISSLLSTDNANELAIMFNCSRKHVYNLVHKVNKEKAPTLFSINS